MTTEPTTDRTVAVLGSGPLAAQLSKLCASHGLRVLTLANGDGGSLAGEPVSEVQVAGSVDELAVADVVIEAIGEASDRTSEVLGAVGDVVASDALVVATSLVHGVSSVASAVRFAHRVVGMCFLEDAAHARFVEVVRTVQADQDPIDRAVAFAEQLDMTAVVVPDRPGFLVNRLLRPYLNDVIQCYDDGLATAEDLDVALELGLGYPIGPLALLDRMGLDAHFEVTAAIWTVTGDDHFAPPPLLRAMVSAGFTGDRAGRGFRSTP